MLVDGHHVDNKRVPDPGVRRVAHPRRVELRRRRPRRARGCAEPTQVVELDLGTVVRNVRSADGGVTQQAVGQVSVGIGPELLLDRADARRGSRESVLSGPTDALQPDRGDGGEPADRWGQIQIVAEMFDPGVALKVDNESPSEWSG